MEGKSSWTLHQSDDIQRAGPCFESFPDRNKESLEEGDQEFIVISIETIVPYDLMERILARLPIPSIFIARSVCNRWNTIVDDKQFLRNFSASLMKKPWYFMFTSSYEPVGRAYDPDSQKWYSDINLPCIESPNCVVSSSYRLLCFMDNASRSQLDVCNPITRKFKMLTNPPNLRSAHYTALAISVDRKLHNYTVSAVKSTQIPDTFNQWELSIHIYHSKTTTWINSIIEELSGWRGSEESVICNGVLYILIYYTGVVTAHSQSRHKLIMYNLSTEYPRNSPIHTSIPVPCIFTCVRLMHLNDKLVMVGGIGRTGTAEKIRGIDIWILNENEWTKISRMSSQFFQGFGGEFHDIFASRGANDIIYIQNYGSPALLMFDMNQRQWIWSYKTSKKKLLRTKELPHLDYAGFCFEPRLEILP